jgi:YihY family inner membrane protein
MATAGQVVARAKARVERARARFGAVDVAVRVFKRYGDDDGGSYAAALTYYIFFSFFPLLLFAAAMLGYLTLGNKELRDTIITEGVKTIPIIEDALKPGGVRTIIENRSGIAFTAAILALYSGSGAIVAFEHALNKLHRLRDEPNWIQKRLKSVKWLALLGIGALVAVGLQAVREWLDNFALASIVFLVGIAITIAVYATAYKFLPAVQQKWSDVLPGAIVAGVGFTLLNLAGTVYLARGQSARNDTFGTFAAAAALLLASYLISQITLLAAEVNLVLQERRETRHGSSLPADQEGEVS